MSLTMLLAFLGAGPLADHLFEPLLAANGGLASSMGAIIGTGPGRGIGLMFILMGLLTIITALGGLLVPGLRHVDSGLPDMDGATVLEQKREKSAAFVTRTAVHSRQSATLSES